MATFREMEHAGWTEKARFYDSHFASVTRQAIEPMLDSLGDITGQSVLDVCCGTGDLAQAALEKGAQVTGVDFAAPMVEIARKKLPAATFVTGDAENLDFEDASFAAVTCAFGIWHLGNPDAALAQSARVLRPGGAFAYTTWLPPEDGWDLMALLMGAITRHGSMDVDLPPAPPPFRFADQPQAKAALIAAGFDTCSFHKHTAIWTGANGDDLLELLYKGIVRAPMLIEAQTSQAKTAVLDDIRQGAERFRQGDALRMRWPYLVACARKPLSG